VEGRFLRPVRGAFVGQAQVPLSGGSAHSATPLPGGQPLTDTGDQANSLVDLGDETFTHVRAHPVIDPLPYR
jgi:hypothetical protein